MAGEFNEKDYLDFSAGVNKNDSDLLLADNECQDARNVFSDGRAIYKRRGFRKLGSTDSYNIITTQEYTNSQGASYLLKVNSNGDLYSILGAPKGQFSVAESVGGSNHTAGDVYYYFIRYVDFDGRKSLPSEIVKYTVSLNCDDIVLSNIPVGPDNIWYKEIYRTNNGEFNFNNHSTTQRIKNSDTTFTDSISGDWTGGTEILGENLYSDSSYVTQERYYHGNYVSIDTTNDVNIVVHKDWAIICNGVDRYKWRAPRKTTYIENNASFGSTDGALEAVSLYQENYVFLDFAPGMHLKLVKTSDLSSTVYHAMCMNVADRYPILLLRLNHGIGSRPSDDALADYFVIAKGEVLPFGVPKPEERTEEIYVNASAGGSATNGDLVRYRIANVNMNGSESATVMTAQVALTANQKVDMKLPPLDWTEITTDGVISITPDSPSTNYARFTVDAKSWVTGTVYLEDEVIRDGSNYYDVVANYTSGASVAADVTAGDLTATTDPGYTFSETFGDYSSDYGEELFIEVDTGTFLYQNLSGYYRVSSNTAPTSSQFDIWSPEAVSKTDLTSGNIKIFKMNRAFCRKLYRTDESGAGEYYHLKNYVKSRNVLQQDTFKPYGNVKVYSNQLRFSLEDTPHEFPLGPDSNSTSYWLGSIKEGDILATGNSFGGSATDMNSPYRITKAGSQFIDVEYNTDIVNGDTIGAENFLGSVQRHIDFIYPIYTNEKEFSSLITPDQHGVLADGLDIRSTVDNTTSPFFLGVTLSQVQPKDNDDPPRFKFANSLNNRLIAGGLNYGGLSTGQQKNGDRHVGIFNYDEVEAMYSTQWTSLSTLGDSTKVSGLCPIGENVIIGTDSSRYMLSGINELDVSNLSVRLLDNIGCVGHRTMQQIIRPSGEQTVILLGNDGLYEIWENGISRPLGAEMRKDWRANHPLKSLFLESLVYAPKYNQKNASSIVQVSESKYLISMKSSTDTKNDIIVSYDYRDNAFWIYDGFNARDLSYWDDRLIHSGDNDPDSTTHKKLYIENIGNNIHDYMDDGRPTEAWIETKYFPMEGMSYVKRWHEITMYPNEYGNYQALNIGTKSEFDNSSTNIGRTEKTVPTGYTARSADMFTGPLTVTVTNTRGNTYRYTSSGSPTLTGVVIGDRVQIWQDNETNGFAYENLGDFAVTGVGSDYFEVTNANGREQATVALVAVGDIVFYTPAGTENDNLTYLFKNIILNSDRDAFRVRVLPCSARFLRFRFESVFSTQKLALAGYTIKYGLQANKGLDR